MSFVFNIFKSQTFTKLIWLHLEADPSVKSSIFVFMFSPMWVVKKQHFSLMFQEPQKIKGAASRQPPQNLLHILQHTTHQHPLYLAAGRDIS